MNYSFLNECDLVNGSGVRVSLFISGCEHHCKGCFSKETWNRNFGEEFSEEVKGKVFNMLSSPYVDGISILGGDPLATYNREEVLELCKEIKEKFPNKTIYIWTGYSTEYTLEHMSNVVAVADIIVTEKFNEEQTKEKVGKKETFYLKGSKNQKFIIGGKVHDDINVEYELDFFN